ncbi:hypothetical protein JKA74_17650 [Marivirga sp. S37H4]|uniref:Uncharacterized protein n=1 Tax=Marivirga aurantiaca TaxID=2802615 RepID=A0A934X0U6_9BACT|nr:hypothetical protein [Marivirga aurantiaca]
MKFLTIGIILAGVFSCQVDSNCGSINVDYITFHLKSLNANGQEQNKTVKYDSIVSPQANMALYKPDSVIAIGAFSLPLSPAENVTDFYLYSANRVDSLRFTYEKINRVDSPECGIDMEFVGLDTVFHSYDSMIIVNDTLRRTVNAPNIKLFIL